MGRWRKQGVDMIVWRFLNAVGDHSWGSPRLIKAISGLTETDLQRVAVPRATKAGLVELSHISSRGRDERRFAASSLGTAWLGMDFEPERLRSTFLRLCRLDVTRHLLGEWAASHLWSVSPYTIPARVLRRPERRGPRREWQPDPASDGPYRSLQLEALVCLQLGDKDFVHLALLYDQAELDSGWLYQQLRTAVALSKREEYRGGIYPILAIITTHADRQALIRDLCERLRDKLWAEELSVFTLNVDQLRRPPGQRTWLTERGQPAGAPWFNRNRCQPAQRPASHSGPWWGVQVESAWRAVQRPRPRQRPRRAACALQSVWSRDHRTTQLLHATAALSLRALPLLARLGDYPLIDRAGLAALQHHDEANIRRGLKELEHLRLAYRPAPNARGYCLTPLGLALLAAGSALSVPQYAQLRRWSVEVIEDEHHYAIERWRRHRAHTEGILQFITGLHRHGAAAGLRVGGWDHVKNHYRLPVARPLNAGQQPAQERLIPDAVGAVWAIRPPLAPAYTQFWLEYDRGTERHGVLSQKLQRYRQLIHGWRSRQPAPRLLVVVEGTERRLNLWLNLILIADGTSQLLRETHLARTEWLRDEAGRLDPTRPAWRTVGSAARRSAFNFPEAPIHVPATTKFQQAVS